MTIDYLEYIEETIMMVTEPNKFTYGQKSKFLSQIMTYCQNKMLTLKTNQHAPDGKVVPIRKYCGRTRRT